MKTYNSKTGFIKRISTGECYESKILYLGIYDSEENYSDITEDEYLNYQEDERKKYEDLSLQKRVEEESSR